MPAYIVISRLHTRNPAKLQEYAALAPGFMAGHNAKFLARFGPSEVREGPEIEGVAIIEFPTVGEAKAWYESAAYQEASEHRYQGGDYSVVILEGGDPKSGK